MGIKIGAEAAASTPGLIYDQVFMVRLDVRQEHQDVEGLQPVYRVKVKYRMYGVDGTGRRHYSGEGIQTAVIDDYLALALVEAGAGSPEWLHAFQGIQNAIAGIVAKARGTTTTVTA